MKEREGERDKETEREWVRGRGREGELSANFKHSFRFKTHTQC